MRSVQGSLRPKGMSIHLKLGPVNGRGNMRPEGPEGPKEPLGLAASCLIGPSLRI